MQARKYSMSLAPASAHCPHSIECEGLFFYVNVALVTTLWGKKVITQCCKVVMSDCMTAVLVLLYTHQYVQSLSLDVCAH